MRIPQAWRDYAVGCCEVSTEKPRLRLPFRPVTHLRVVVQFSFLGYAETHNPCHSEEPCDEESLRLERGGERFFASAFILARAPAQNDMPVALSAKLNHYPFEPRIAALVPLVIVVSCFRSEGTVCMN